MTIQNLQLLKVYSVDEIRGIPFKAAPRFEVILRPSNARYLFDSSSTADDDGELVLAPAMTGNECCTGGRWIREATPGEGGGSSPDVGDITMAQVAARVSLRC